jgi:hypothetical protein
MSASEIDEANIAEVTHRRRSLQLKNLIKEGRKSDEVRFLRAWNQEFESIED